MEKSGKMNPTEQQNFSPRGAEERRGPLVRLSFCAVVGSLLTAALMGWMWGTIAPYPVIVLADIPKEAANVTRLLIEKQIEGFKP
uniref:hypothetical protein n=1 Tax=Streptomyces sp. HK1 TaxID=405041 RepID=UPI0015E86190|nr:hypothetical protein [Streptomyces sp. HK1]